MNGSATVAALEYKSSYYKHEFAPSARGGDAIIFITPLTGSNGEKFFYAKNVGGYFEVSGKVKIFAADENAEAELCRLREEAESELNGDTLLYFIQDDDGLITKRIPVCKKEAS